ncbi:MAG: hypothetical protein Q4F75_08060, partial [Pseudomonadota bacterium]|nr:hypothetical protein [Pseudomonadota bacterium]
MNINLKFLLLGTSLSLIPTLTNAQCVATTDCASLGYTQTSCPDGKGLKCPFGNTFACPASDKSVCEKYGFKYTCSGTGYDSGAGQSCNNKYASCNCSSGYEWKAEQCKKYSSAILGQCSGYAKNCKIGDILNNDGICSNDKVSGKTPIGVVVTINSNCGYAMTISPIGSYSWGGYNQDIPNLPNHTNYTTAIADYDGYNNTQKIIQAGDGNKFPAAWATINYTPTIAPDTKGKWHLPAAGIWNTVYKNMSTINNTLSKIGGMPFSNDTHHWSSSEYDGRYAWYFCTGEIEGQSYAGINFLNSSYTKAASYYVRPVIAF